MQITEIKGIGENTISILHTHGIWNTKDLLSVEPHELINIKGLGIKKLKKLYHSVGINIDESEFDEYVKPVMIKKQINSKIKNNVIDYVILDDKKVSNVKYKFFIKYENGDIGEERSWYDKDMIKPYIEDVKKNPYVNFKKIVALKIIEVKVSQKTPNTTPKQESSKLYKEIKI